MSNFWDSIWLILSSFIFIAYLLVLFQIVGDLFRNSETRSIYKAFWIVGLIFVPMFTALIYIVRHGAGMASRQRAAIAQATSHADASIRQVAGKSSVEQIGEAKALLDSGAITAEEFAQLKAKALA